MPKPTTLSTTARAVLTAAAARHDHLALPPERLPAAARRAVLQSMLKAGLLEEVAADDDQPTWRTTESGERSALRITDAGLNAIGIDGQAKPSQPARQRRGELPAAETASPAPHAPEQPDAADELGA